MNEMKINSLAPWFGAKRTMAARIARECCRKDGSPPKSFWDCCCGSMAVSLAMPKCAQHHAVDIHQHLLNLANVIKDPELGPQFYRTLRRVLNHETLFHEAKSQLESEGSADLFGGGEPLSDLDRAIAYFIVSWQGRNGVAGTRRVNYQPAIRWTSGGGHGASRFKSAVDSIPAWRRRLRSISILDRDMFLCLKRIDDQEGTTIYIDPPYLRDGEGRSGSAVYEHEFTTRQHIEMRDLLLRFENTRVVVSYYDHPVLREWYDGWTVVDCMTQKNLHVQNRRGNGACDAPEILIINGPSYTENSTRRKAD